MTKPAARSLQRPTAAEVAGAGLDAVLTRAATQLPPRADKLASYGEVSGSTLCEAVRIWVEGHLLLAQAGASAELTAEEKGLLTELRKSWMSWPVPGHIGAPGLGGPLYCSATVSAADGLALVDTAGATAVAVKGIRARLHETRAAAGESLDGPAEQSLVDRALPYARDWAEQQRGMLESIRTLEATLAESEEKLRPIEARCDELDVQIARKDAVLKGERGPAILSKNKRQLKSELVALRKSLAQASAERRTQQDLIRRDACDLDRRKKALSAAKQTARDQAVGKLTQRTTRDVDECLAHLSNAESQAERWSDMAVAYWSKGSNETKVRRNVQQVAKTIAIALGAAERSGCLDSVEKNQVNAARAEALYIVRDLDRPAGLGSMPFDEYCKSLAKVDMLIDQAAIVGAMCQATAAAVHVRLAATREDLLAPSLAAFQEAFARETEGAESYPIRGVTAGSLVVPANEPRTVELFTADGKVVLRPSRYDPQTCTDFSNVHPVTLRPGWIGITIQPLSPELAESLGLKTTEGALVAQVFPGSPADDAKLQERDVVLSIDGKPVRDCDDLRLYASVAGVGSDVHLKLWRDGSERNVEVRLRESPRRLPL